MSKLTVTIPDDLHQQIRDELERQGIPTSQFIEQAITTFFEKPKGVRNMATRTLAFQVSEELLQRIKTFLARYEQIYHRKLSQKEFLVHLIERELDEAEKDYERITTEQAAEENADVDSGEPDGTEMEVDMSNRLICFNIQSLGEQLKPVAMLSMLEYINTAVMSNERNDPKAATWVYFDEIYLLLRDSLSANFLYTSWKRFRKYNAYATGITQNVQDCLTNDTAYAMLANSEFVVMLRQTKDIDSVVELYGLSEPQRKYLLLAQPGEGIIKMGNSLIPFNNPQPKDTKTYKLLTTKPGEME